MEVQSVIPGLTGNLDARFRGNDVSTLSNLQYQVSNHLMIRRYSINVHGRVQGVFFRQSAKRWADELNLTGLVRNEPDASVYIEVEGEEKNLQKFIAWCQQGPEFAKINKVDVHKSIPSGQFDDFTIA